MNRWIGVLPPGQPRLLRGPHGGFCDGELQMPVGFWDGVLSALDG
ncbi:MAG: hypothetical protein ACK583_02110 [Cyanobacteriota bacterium]